jgi:hypothetical protein
MQWTGSLHLLGEHEEELKEARRGSGIYPHILNLRAFEARALAALGRIGEVEKMLEDILAIPSQWAYPSCCVPRATPAYVMLVAAEELREHGKHGASLKIAGRAVDWYCSRVGEEARQEDIRSVLGDALYQAERWEEARAVFAALASEHPADIFYKGRLGTLAARRGDWATAHERRKVGDELDTSVLYRGQRRLQIVEGVGRVLPVQCQLSPDRWQPDRLDLGIEGMEFVEVLRQRVAPCRVATHRISQRCFHTDGQALWIQLQSRGRYLARLH